MAAEATPRTRPFRSDPGRPLRESGVVRGLVCRSGDVGRAPDRVEPGVERMLTPKATALWFSFNGKPRPRKKTDFTTIVDDTLSRGGGHLCAWVVLVVGGPRWVLLPGRYGPASHAPLPPGRKRPSASSCRIG